MSADRKAFFPDEKSGAPRLTGGCFVSVIDVNLLTKDYGFGRGVFDVTFSVPDSEVFGFLGPNGAGKSTTIRHLMGFSAPDKGTVEIFGKPSFNRYYEILGKVGYIPGEIALPAGLTGTQFLRMMQGLQGHRDDAKLNSLLKLFELDPSGDTKRMSLGVKRKLAVVTAFMNDPEVLILDEPTSGLDPVMQEIFIDYIKNEKKRGKTIMLSSHIFSEADAVCDRIAIIKDGRIVSVFDIDSLHHSSFKNYELFFRSKPELEKFVKENQDSKAFKIASTDAARATALISTEDKDVNAVIEALSHCDLKDFVHRQETLEDYFMSYYKEDIDFKEVF